MMSVRVLDKVDPTEQSGRQKGQGQGRSSKGTAGLKTLREENEAVARGPKHRLKIPKHKTDKIQVGLPFKELELAPNVEARAHDSEIPRSCSDKGHRVLHIGAKTINLNHVHVTFFLIYLDGSVTDKIHEHEFMPSPLHYFLK